MKWFANICLAAGLLTTLVQPLAAVAEPNAPETGAAAPVVIELFASQNCRACPKAHRTLREVEADGANVLILTWSVDYWDYLGDDDPMAMEESVQRQIAYVEQFSLRGPYTPQTVYNGAEQCPGNRPQAVRRNISKAVAADQPAATIRRDGERLVVEGDAAASGALTLVEYLEDAAHDTEMRHPVVDYRPLTAFDGGRLEIAAPACAQACAVLLETPGAGITASHVVLQGQP